MCTLREGEVAGDGDTGGTPVLPLPLVLPWTEAEGEKGDEGALSDLDEDIEEYIASASEVWVSFLHTYVLRIWQITN